MQKFQRGEIPGPPSARFACCLAAAALAALAAGCQTTSRFPTATRAIWVTRGDYKTPDDVLRIMQDCQSAGFSTVMFQVRGNGTAFYRSRLEPWADELGGKYPGFDPLRIACDEAHTRGMQLHAWVNVMPAWRGTTPPANPDQLYNKHPEWFWYDQHGERQALSSFYVSLNPCLPEVREYLVRVFREVVAGYKVDGLHLDYIRFPNEPPATPKDSGLDYPRDARTLELYRRETGKSPDDNIDDWKRWRAAQVTRLVRSIHDMVQRTRPRALLTAAVGSKPEGPLEAHYRDSDTWVRQRLVDAVFPMNYTDKVELFAERAKAWTEPQYGVPVVTGIMLDNREPSLIDEQIGIAIEHSPHLCLFAYAALFDRGENQPETQPSDSRIRRAERRARVIEALQQPRRSE
ncbi:MAG TPA: family 10 glycosylhydrolase [Phycisphaerae bacterium]